MCEGICTNVVFSIVITRIMDAPHIYVYSIVSLIKNVGPLKKVLRGEMQAGGYSICLYLTGMLLQYDPRRLPPRQHAYTFVIRILSTFLTSVSIFYVYCYSRYLSLWGQRLWGGVVVSFYFSNRPDTYITLILSPWNFGVSLKDHKIAKAGGWGGGGVCTQEKSPNPHSTVVCVSANFFKGSYFYCILWLQNFVLFIFVLRFLEHVFFTLS